MGNQQTQGLSAEEILSRENIKSLDWETKQKLSSSHVKYNLRIIIRGDRNTGKTCLWRRLQGLPFVEAYSPTPEIQVCNIHWSYKNTDDLIKIEIWDVVDKAKKKKKEGLKVEDSSSDEEAIPTMPNLDNNGNTTTGNFTVQRLDASLVDVYKGTHGVIIMIDPTKKWTFEYAQRELENVPKDVYVLLLVNYRDMGDYRVISDNDIREYVKFQDHPNVKCLDASMKNSFGLKSVITFFNLPFLKLQRSYIEQQLKLNSDEIQNVEKEIDLVTKEQNYDFYLKWIEQTKKNKSKGSSGPASPINSGSKTSALSQSAPVLPSVPLKRPSIDVSTPPVPSSTIKTVPTPNTTISLPPTQQQQQVNRVTPPTSNQSTTNRPSQVTNNAPPAQVPATTSGGGGGFFSKLMSRVSGNASPAPPQVDTKKAVEDLKMMAANKKGPTQNIDDFTTGTLDEDFLSDGNASVSVTNKSIEDDSDEDSANPMVIQDEDIDEPTPPPKPKTTTVPSAKALSPPVKAASPPSTKTVSPSPPTTKVVSPTVAPTKTIIPTTIEEEPQSSDEDTPNPLVKRNEEEEEDNEDDWGSPSVSIASSQFPATSSVNNNNEDSDEDAPNPLVSRDDFEEDFDEPVSVNVSKTKSPVSSYAPTTIAPTTTTTTPVNIQAKSTSVAPASTSVSSNGSLNSSKVTETAKSPQTPPTNSRTVANDPISDEDDEDAPNPLVSKFYDDDDDDSFVATTKTTTKTSSNGVSLGYEDFEDISEAGFEAFGEEEPQPEPQPKKTTSKSKSGTSAAPKKKKKATKPVNETPEEREERKRRHKAKKTTQKKSVQAPVEQEEEDDEQWI